jgi:hypothetical protein
MSEVQSSPHSFTWDDFVKLRDDDPRELIAGFGGRLGGGPYGRARLMASCWPEMDTACDKREPPGDTSGDASGEASSGLTDNAWETTERTAHEGVYRSANRATDTINSDGSTGFDRCRLNPTAKARRRSSPRT